MKINNIYTSENGERLYSVLMTEEEISLYSKKDDEDYIKRQNSRKKWAKAYIPTTALAGGGLGGVLGNLHSKKAAIIGAGLGTAAGVLGGKKLKEREIKLADRKSQLYRKSSEADKKRLRDLEKEEIRNSGAFVML